MSEHRLWEPVKFPHEWIKEDTSRIDDIAPSWFKRQHVLQGSAEYEDFLAKLKRDHAIETGVIERLYDLKKSASHILVDKGFFETHVNYSDSNIATSQLMLHLRDQLNGINFIFDAVAVNRSISISLIKDLHIMVTKCQRNTKGLDQFGNVVDVPMEKGKFKTKENGIHGEDDVVIQYCPPSQTSTEMDQLLKVYKMLEQQKVHPVIIAAWFHHMFTMIHPFQDGNGRVVRLLVSMILIKHNYFPFTVDREARKEYFDALSDATTGRPQTLIYFISDIQRRKIEQALNLRDVTSASLEQVASVLLNRITTAERERSEKEARQKTLNDNRNKVGMITISYLHQLKDILISRMQGKMAIAMLPTNKIGNKESLLAQYAEQHGYYFNNSLPRGFIILGMQVSDNASYQLLISIHHYGYDDATLAIGAIFHTVKREDDNNTSTTTSLSTLPHIISIAEDDISSKEKNIKLFLEDTLSAMIAQIASEIN